MQHPCCIESELLAAQLQLQELREQLASKLDAQAALSAFLQQTDHSDEQQAADQQQNSVECSIPLDEWETSYLQEQIIALSSLIENCKSQEVAASLQAREDAAVVDAAYTVSLEVAGCLAEQESWHKRIYDHDAVFARQLAQCDSLEWEERGDRLEHPLLIEPRPSSPEVREVLVSTSQPSAACCATDTTDNTPHAATKVQACGGSNIMPATNTACNSSDLPLTTCGRGSSKGKEPMSSTASPDGSNNSSSSGHNHSQFQAAVQCGICFDEFPASSMVSAVLPQQMASSSSSEGRCGHHFCRDCMRTYVQEQIKVHRYPICCPMPCCCEEISHDDVSMLLKDEKQQMLVLNTLVMEHSIDASLRVYCPFKDCSCLLERPEDMDVDAAGQVDPFECPSCHRAFCLHCKTAGWHMGMTCQQFQALPPELRSVEDAAMLRMAAAKAWKRCPAPGCGHIVERTEGCNHMRCRCGVSFCYACGKQYQNSKSTAANVHGTPGCKCELFTIPDEDPPENNNVVVPAAAAAVVLRPFRHKPFRNGRDVSRTRCHHSDSIYDCPHGPSRCWFWHDEDDDFNGSVHDYWYDADVDEEEYFL